MVSTRPDGPKETVSQILRSRIADLLSQAGSAHHDYEQTVLKGVYDQDWAVWYAEYVIEHGLNKVVPQSMRIDQLGRFLTEIHQLYSEENPDLSWADFTAIELAKQFS